MATDRVVGMTLPAFVGRYFYEWELRQRFAYPSVFWQMQDDRECAWRVRTGLVWQSGRRNLRLAIERLRLPAEWPSERGPLGPRGSSSYDGL